MLFIRVLLFSFFAAALLCAQESRVFESKHATQDIAPDTNPKSQFWRGAPAIIADRDSFGKFVPGHRTEVRSRWTKENLYFLFICPYEQLNLKPQPRTDVETNHLWDWDVAEVFIGSDFKNIRKYKEFEVSPQGEWNSGFKVVARIDESSKVWYACMRIPYSSVDVKPAAAGNILRVNFYRAQGPLSQHKAIAWQPTHQATYHVPETFGNLRLAE
jgi:hypothetical protein